MSSKGKDLKTLFLYSPLFQTLVKTAGVAVVSRTSEIAAAGAARAVDGCRNGTNVST